MKDSQVWHTATSLKNKNPNGITEIEVSWPVTCAHEWMLKAEIAVVQQRTVEDQQH